jgi:hypothetical protein
MNSRRTYFLLVGTVTLLFIGLVFGAYATNKLFTAKSNALLELKAKSQALSEEKISLTKAKRDLEKYAELQKITKQIVPEDKNQAAAVREIVNIAAANSISLAAINFPASTLGGAPNGLSTRAGATATPVVSSKSLTQVEPVKNIPGVYILPITVQGNPDSPVEYTRFINFLKALERNRRTAQVSSISLEPYKGNPGLLTFTLTLNEYIKP